MDDSQEIIGASPIPDANIPEEPRKMSFTQALDQVIDGKKITKLEWADDRIYGYMKDDLLQLHKANDENYIWQIHINDLTGIDWVVVQEGN